MCVFVQRTYVAQPRWRRTCEGKAGFCCVDMQPADRLDPSMMFFLHCLLSYFFYSLIRRIYVMWSFIQRNASVSFQFESHTQSQSLVVHVEQRGWRGAYLDYFERTCLWDRLTEDERETDREDKVKTRIVGRCTCTKQRAQTSPTRSRRGPGAREGSRPKAQVREGWLSRHPRGWGWGHAPMLLWCCGRPAKATVWQSSNSWRSFSTSTRCHCMTQWRAGQACSTGNLHSMSMFERMPSTALQQCSKCYAHRPICHNGNTNSNTS